MNTLSDVHGESVLPNWFGEPTKVFTRRTSTALVSTSFAIPLKHKQVRIHHYPLVITITDSDSISDDDLSIALRKGKRTYTSHPISCFVSYSHLSPSFHAFISSLDSYLFPNLYQKSYLFQVGRIP